MSRHCHIDHHIVFNPIHYLLGVLVGLLIGGVIMYFIWPLLAGIAVFWGIFQGMWSGCSRHH